MKKRRRLALLALMATLALSGAIVNCGSPDCADTATCADGDGSAADHTTTEDSPPPGRDAETPKDASDSGKPDDEANAGDSSETGDTATQDAADAIAATDARDAGSACVAADSGDACNEEDASACDPSAPDCSNPQCESDFMCTPATPTGWSGPIALYDQGGGPPAPVAPTCSGNYSFDSFDGNSSPTSPATSCGCTCGAAQDVCSNPSIAIYPDNACVPTNRCGSAGPATCTVANGSPLCPNGGESAQVAVPPQPTGTGSCTAGSTVNGLPASEWARTGRGCGSSRAFSTGGCAGAQVCANKPSSSFLPALCVWQNGSTTCSSATGYPVHYTYYAGVVDSRGCATGSCGCGSPTDVSCSLTGVTSYTTPTCSDGGTLLANLDAGFCNVIGNLQVWGITTSVATAGRCASSGSATSTGSVVPDPSRAITVCCTQ